MKNQGCDAATCLRVDHTSASAGLRFDCLESLDSQCLRGRHHPLHHDLEGRKILEDA